jgi:hypothetical protein
MTPLVARAPDATVMLSTAALIVGVFLAVVAAALAGNLPSRSEYMARPAGTPELEFKYQKLVRAILFLLVVINTFGTLFPFTLLFVNTLRSLESAWIWIAFLYTLFVIIVNLSVVSLIYLSPAVARRRQRTSRLSAKNK